MVTKLPGYIIVWLTNGPIQYITDNLTIRPLSSTINKWYPWSTA